MIVEGGRKEGRDGWDGMGWDGMGRGQANCMC